MMSDAHDDANPLKAADWRIALGLLGLTFLAGCWRMAPGVCGVYHDDAIYVSTAEALARGDGYRLIDVPGAPLQTKYPVIYSALLAAVWRLWPVFPQNLIAMQVLTLLSAAGTIALGYLYLVRFRYFPRAVAAGAGVLCATAPNFLYFGVQTMAEMPFALLSIASLWALESPRLRTTTRLGQFGLGLLLSVPFLCRTIGATLIVAGLFVLWRQQRPLKWSLAGVLTGTIPWVLWSLAGRGVWDHNPVDGYYTDYVGCWSSTGIGMMGRVVSWNALMILYGTGELALEGFSSSAKQGLGPGAAVAILMLLGAVAWGSMAPDLWRGRALPWALAAYLAAMLVWSWPPYRFLIPILPFLAAYLFSGPVALLRRLEAGPNLQWAGAAVMGILTIANGGLLAQHAWLTSHTGYPVVNPADAKVTWAPYQRTFAWLRQNSGRDDVLSSGLDSMVALYTNRQAFRPVVYNPGRLFYGQGNEPLLTGKDLAVILQRGRPRYLLEIPMPGFAEEQPLAQAILELQRQHPDWLKVAYQDADPRFVVYELNPQREPLPGGNQTKDAVAAAPPPAGE